MKRYWHWVVTALALASTCCAFLTTRPAGVSQQMALLLSETAATAGCQGLFPTERGSVKAVVDSLLLAWEQHQVAEVKAAIEGVAQDWKYARFKVLFWPWLRAGLDQLSETDWNATYAEGIHVVLRGCKAGLDSPAF